MCLQQITRGLATPTQKATKHMQPMLFERPLGNRHARLKSQLLRQSQKCKTCRRLRESVDFRRYIVQIDPGGVLFCQKAASTALKLPPTRQKPSYGLLLYDILYS